MKIALHMGKFIATLSMLLLTTANLFANSAIDGTKHGLDGHDIVVTATLESFTQTIGAASAAQTYSVSATALTANLIITAPANFELSLDGVAWSTDPLNLTHTGGVVDPTTIHLRLNASSQGTYFGNIVHSSTDATDEALGVHGVTLPVGTWTVYHANVLPNAFTPAFSTSSTAGTFSSDLESDPDNFGNSLLRMDVPLPNPPNGNQTFLWRRNFTSPNQEVTNLTVIIRAKGNPDRDMALDLDLHYSNIRSRVAILTSGNQAVIRNGSGSTANLSVNVTEWNTYRFVMSKAQTLLYLNDDAEPSMIFTPATAVSGNRHFRFGDGDNALTFGADIDFIAWDVTQPLDPALSITAALDPFEQEIGAPSTVQTYTLSADNLIADLTVTPPAGYEISNDDGANWFDNGNPLVLTQSAGAIANTTISVRLNASTQGDYNGNITHVSPGLNTNLALTGAATEVGTPLLTLTGTLNSFSQRLGTPSAVQTYTIEGSTLAGNITITPPAGYEVSDDDGTTWFDAVTPLVLTEAAGVVAETTITVRLNADALGDYAGDIVHSSTDATDALVAVTGKTLPENTWTVYRANQLPLQFDPAFVVSQQSGTFSNTIVEDPDLAGNRLLLMVTAANGDNNQWRQNLTGGTTDLTLVIRAKGNDAGKNLVVDADLDFNTSRFQMRILSNGNYTIANGTPSTGGSTGVNTLEWNRYRFTKKGDVIAVYANESTTPFYTGTAVAAGGNNYFRFGDGWGSGTIDSSIDYVIWDTSGAYSPEEYALPNTLYDAEPNINIVSSIIDFTQIIGSPSESQSYKVSGFDLTEDISITPPENYEVSLDEVTWFTNTTPLLISPVAEVVDETTIFVRLNAALNGDYAGSISHTSAGAITRNVAVNGVTQDESAAALEVVASFTNFIQTVGTPSAAQTYTISGVNLTNDVTITPSAGYEVSEDGSIWFDNSTPLVLTHTAGELAQTSISVRLNASSAASYNGGSITHTTTDVTDIVLTVNGFAQAVAVVPPELPAGNWSVYHANELPNAFVPAFVTSSGTFSVNENEIIVDPDDSGNNLLKMQVAGNPNAQFWWRLNFAGLQIPVENLTVAIRAKGNPVNDMALDMDLEYGGRRSRVSVHNVDNTARVRNPSSGPIVDLGVDVTAWNIYRFVMTPDQTRLYINDATEPILVFSPQVTGTNTHFRFGDGDSANTMGADIDWVAWDVTSAGLPTIEVTSALTDFAQTTGTPSDVQTYTVSASNLIGGLTIAPPEAYEVSSDDGATWFDAGTPLVLAPASGLVDANVSVRLNAISSGAYSGNIIHTSDGATSKQVAVIGTTIGEDEAVISVTSSLSNFVQTIGSPSAVQTYTVSGVNLSAGITISPPTGFEVTTDAITWFKADAPLVVAPTDGTVAETTISIRLNAASIGNYSGNISHSSDGALSIDVAITGTTNPEDTWNIYRANQLPNEFNPPFVQATGVFRAEENSIIDDTEIVNNKILRMNVNGPGDPDDAGAQSAFLWRKNFVTQDVNVTNLTLVMRVKGNSARDMAMDLDMHYNDIRSRISLHTANNSANARNGTGDPVVLADAITEWRIYRFTMTPTATHLYVDEDPTPVFTLVPQSSPSGNRHFRFGDGDSGRTFGADIDWVIWDVTGAYSPVDAPLPDNLYAEEIPDPAMELSGTLNNFSQVVGTPSDVQTYTISGSNLTGNLTITPPAGFEVSSDATTWFSNTTPLVLTPMDGGIASTTISVRLNATESGEYAGNIAHTTSGAAPINLAVTGLAVNETDPVINVTASLSNFTHTVGTPSAAQMYTLSANNLTEGISITPLEGYEVSVDGTNWSNNANPLVINPTDGVVAETTVSVRLNASAAGNFTGNIVHTSAGAVTINVAVTGTANPVPLNPTITVSGSLNAFAQALGDPSELQTYNVSAVDLSASLTITPPANFQVSVDGVTWRGNTSPLSIAPTNGVVTSTTISVRLNATVAANYSGNILHTSAGATTVPLPVSGEAQVVISVGETPNLNFSMSPNPATDKLTVQRTDASSDAAVHVYSITGVKVGTYDMASGIYSLDVDVSSFAGGLYYVEYLTNRGKKTMRMVKL